MADDSASHQTPLSREEIREIISEEIGKAMQAGIPSFLDQLQTTLLAVVEEKCEEIRENVLQEMSRTPVRKACPYNKFMACKPNSYDGEVNPVLCQRWLTEIEDIFERTGCEEQDKVTYATGQLHGLAKSWWDVKRSGLSPQALKAFNWCSYTM